MSKPSIKNDNFRVIMDNEKIEMEPFFGGIREIAKQINELQEIAVVQYTPIVENIINTQNRNENQIEHTLDRLLDFACHPDGLKLFKKLCRYYYFINPQVSAEYVMIYRYELGQA